MTRPAWLASRRGRAWAWVLAAGVLAAAAVRAPGAAGDLRAAAAIWAGCGRPGWVWPLPRRAWLALAVALDAGVELQRDSVSALGVLAAGIE